MIKVGITGGETPLAGEILRLLIHHPDVEIVSIHSPANAGKPVAAIHHGFIGEQKLLFTSHFDATALDFAIIIAPLHSASEWSKIMADNPGLKLILFDGSAQLAAGLDRQPVFGLSEINRKSLVRGARTAIVPDTLSALALIALYPLASHLMLPDNLSLHAAIPRGLTDNNNYSETSKQIRDNIVISQTGFNGDLPVVIDDSGRQRGCSVEFTIPGSTPADEIFKIYDSIYDDHNFTFLVPFDVDFKEVEGTHRCVISISKPTDDTIRIRAVADARMRGSAGEAVHILNLMAGLFEKTGLTLKTI